MKPVTNILLIVSLICYVFLPFMTMDLTGSGTGLHYTANMITENFSVWRTIFGLLPFIVCFAGVTLNCMKHRYWGLVAGIVILFGLYFYMAIDPEIKFPLMHEPDVVGENEMEGMPVKEMASGYYVGYALMWLSLISCIVSLMPFKFNTILERSIDEGIEKGIHFGKEELHKVGHEIHDEFEHLEGKHHKEKAQTKETAAPPETATEVAQEETPARHEENPEDYMPKDTSAPTENAEEKKDTESDDEKWADYMPK